MELKNEQLSHPVGTKTLHVAGCNGIDKVDWIVLEKDRFPSQHKFLSRQFGDLSTFGDGKISKKFDLPNPARNAVERSPGRSRSCPAYSRLVATVSSVRFFDSGPANRLPCRTGSAKFRNGRE